MFQDMTKTLNQSMEPFKDLINIQTRMLEKLTRQQMECTRSCIEATIHQTRELQHCKSPKEMLDLQAAYASELEIICAVPARTIFAHWRMRAIRLSS